jgi:hypothetical protein
LAAFNVSLTASEEKKNGRFSIVCVACRAFGVECEIFFRDRKNLGKADFLLLGLFRCLNSLPFNPSNAPAPIAIGAPLEKYHEYY